MVEKITFSPQRAYGFFSKKRNQARFHRRNRIATQKIYKNLLKNKELKPPTSQELKMIKSYSCDFFGTTNYRYWLQIYTVCRGQFKEGWIPDDFFGRITPKLNSLYRSVSAAKTLNARLFGIEYLPDQAYYINGLWVDTHLDRIAPQELRETLFEKSDRIFAKCELSECGRGIIPLSKANFDHRKLQQLGNLVVQNAIEQHIWFEEFFPGCVATLRVTTAVPYGTMNPTVHASYLRLGQGDTEFIKSSQSLRVAVIDDEGTLDNKAFDAQWQIHHAHPDTGIPFAGKKIPFFADAVSVCEQLHAKICQFIVVGWDVAINANGRVEVMEWNAGHPDIRLNEAINGPCFVDLHLERLAQKS